jgi:hypothetical protein
MRNFILTTVFVAVAAVSFVGGATWEKTKDQPADSVAICTEDSTCWNWETMGNQRRKLTLSDGTAVVQSANPEDLREMPARSWACYENGMADEAGTASGIFSFVCWLDPLVYGSTVRLPS